MRGAERGRRRRRWRWLKEVGEGDEESFHTNSTSRARSFVHIFMVGYYLLINARNICPGPVRRKTWGLLFLFLESGVKYIAKDR